MRILVCGSKNWKDYDLIFSRLSLLPKSSMLLVDCSPGAPEIAARAANNLGLKHIQIFPQIVRTFRSCGPLNDSFLTRYSLPELVIAFKCFKPFCRTTHFIIQRARSKHIRVEEIFEDNTKVEQLNLFGYTSPLKGVY